MGFSVLFPERIPPLRAGRAVKKTENGSAKQKTWSRPRFRPGGTAHEPGIGIIVARRLHPVFFRSALVFDLHERPGDQPLADRSKDLLRNIGKLGRDFGFLEVKNVFRHIVCSVGSGMLPVEEKTVFCPCENTIRGKTGKVKRKTEKEKCFLIKCGFAPLSCSQKTGPGMSPDP